MINISANLERNASVVPDKAAVMFADRSLTYAQLDAAASRVAHGLSALGIQKGDKVALCCPNLPYFPIVFYGVLKLGAVIVPISILHKADEIAFVLQDSDAKAFLCFEGTGELPTGTEGQRGFVKAATCESFIVITADPAEKSPFAGYVTLEQLTHGKSPVFDYAATNADDTAIILYTSGTTGKPKGAENTHGSLGTNIQVFRSLFRHVSTDVQLVALPLFHTFAMNVQMNLVIADGATMVLLPRFDPDAVLKAMLEYSVTIFAGVPTMYISLLNLRDAEQRYDVKAIAAKLRLGLSGGAAMPVEVARRLEERYQFKILEGYGLSESAAIVSINHLDFSAVLGSVGQPIAGVLVRIVDKGGCPVPIGQDGEIIFRGHNVMKGYYKNVAATADSIRNGWFHTGDIGRLDERGYLHVVDRLKDMIIRSGFNVYPRELEEVLMTHEAVAQAAVVGVPHDTHGEEVKAFIVLKANKSLLPEDLIAWSKQRMAVYKYPRFVEIVASLPMTASGKVLKRALYQFASRSPSAAWQRSP